MITKVLFLKKEIFPGSRGIRIRSESKLLSDKSQQTDAVICKLDSQGQIRGDEGQ